MSRSDSCDRNLHRTEFACVTVYAAGKHAVGFSEALQHEFVSRPLRVGPLTERTDPSSRTIPARDRGVLAAAESSGATVCGRRSRQLLGLKDRSRAVICSGISRSGCTASTR